jgi:REP element-mobilizing transposase RayT
MPRRVRAIEGGYAYHVLSRANARLPLFNNDGNYAAFEQVLGEAFAREALRILGYRMIPNYWHLVVEPQAGKRPPSIGSHALANRHARSTLARPSPHVGHGPPVSGVL